MQLSGRLEGSFWPRFVPLPAVPPKPEDDTEEDAEVDDGEDVDVVPLRRPAARGPLVRPAASKSRLRRPAAADSRLASGEGEPVAPVFGDGDGAEAAPVMSPVRPMRRPAAKRTSQDAVAGAEGDETYGCGRCLLRTTGCSICRKPGYKARGPRREGGGNEALPAAPAAC